MKPSKHLKTIKLLNEQKATLKAWVDQEHQLKERAENLANHLRSEHAAEIERLKKDSQHEKYALLDTIRLQREECSRLWYLMRVHAGDLTIKMEANKDGYFQNTSTFNSSF